MLRRWNLTIIVIVTAFVLGVVAGYTYRDRFSWLLLNKAEFERTEPAIEEEIFQAEIEDILRPESGIDAVSQSGEVHVFTGYVRALSAERIMVEEPDGAIDFILTADTSYTLLETFANEYELPDSKQTDISQSDIALDDMVTVYTVEDIRTAPERHVILVQKLNN